MRKLDCNFLSTSNYYYVDCCGAPNKCGAHRPRPIVGLFGNPALDVILDDRQHGPLT